MVRPESGIMVGSWGSGIDCEGGAGGAPRLEERLKKAESFGFGGILSPKCHSYRSRVTRVSW